MIPDLTNPHGIAALVVTTSCPTEQGMNYILATDGTGLMSRNTSGGSAWVAFTALPTDVDIATVVDWTPWTLYLNDGSWYFRGTIGATWEAAAIGNETAPEFVPPQKPAAQLPPAFTDEP